MKKNILFLFLAVSLFVPFSAFADHTTAHTISTLKMKIAELQARLDVLRKLPLVNTVLNNAPKITFAGEVPAVVEPGGELSMTWLADDRDNDDLVWAVNWGDGTTSTIPCRAVPFRDKSSWKHTATHLWGYKGVYTGTVSVSDCRGGVDVRSFEVTIDKKQIPPIIKNIFGLRELPVGEITTWMVDAYDPDKGALTYQVFWGDGEVTLPVFDTFLRTQNPQAQTTFIHSFKKAGTFNAKFSVVDADGLSTTTSIAIRVGDLASVPTLQILSPNGGESWTVGSSQTVRWASKAIPSDHRVEKISLREIYSGWEGTLLSDVVNDGIEEVITPFPTKGSIPGSYFVQIRTRVGDRVVFDESDAAFNVVASFNRVTPSTLSASVINSIRSQLEAITLKLQELKKTLVE